MFRTAEVWIFEEMGVKMPEGSINGAWFAENELPMVVECSCCETTMMLPSAMVDREGYIFCRSCAEQLRGR